MLWGQVAKHARLHCQLPTAISYAAVAALAHAGYRCDGHSKCCVGLAAVDTASLAAAAAWTWFRSGFWGLARGARSVLALFACGQRVHKHIALQHRLTCADVHPRCPGCVVLWWLWYGPTADWTRFSLIQRAQRLACKQRKNGSRHVSALQT